MYPKQHLSRKMYSLYVVLSFGIMMVSASPTSMDLEVNNKCSFTSGKNIFTCQGLSNVNKDIDKFITADTHLLIIKNSTGDFKLETDHHNTVNFKHIVSYDILDNKHVQIEEFAFRGLSGLRYMKIRGNVVDTLKRNIFGGLSGLEMINLGNNKISHIEDGAFNDLTNLITLDLSENLLETLPSNIFNGLSSLQTLFLEHNSIRSVEPHAFTGLSELSMLDLARNSIEIILCDELSPMENLESLYFSYNRIKEIKGDLRLPKLGFLELGNNELTILSNTVFKQLVSIKSINLANNKLNGLNEDPFLNLSNLKHVNLRNNNLKDSVFANLKQTVSVVV